MIGKNSVRLWETKGTKGTTKQGGNKGCQAIMTMGVYMKTASWTGKGGGSAGDRVNGECRCRQKEIAGRGEAA